jgi:hypothetical protein
MTSAKFILRHPASALLLMACPILGCKQYAAPVTSGVRLKVTIRTAGAANDPDGFLFSLDNKTPKRIPTQVDLYYPDMLRTYHTIMLTDLAPGCAVSPSNPYTFDLGLDQPPTLVELTVGCAAPTPP